MQKTYYNKIKVSKLVFSQLKVIDIEFVKTVASLLS